MLDFLPRQESFAAAGKNSASRAWIFQIADENLNVDSLAYRMQKAAHRRDRDR
jgi:hypothetical protein